MVGLLLYYVNLLSIILGQRNNVYFGGTVVKFFNKDKFEKFSILMITEMVMAYDEPSYRKYYYAIMPYQERDISHAYREKARVSLRLEDNTVYGLDFADVINYSIVPVYNMEDVEQLVVQPGVSKNNRITIYGISSQLVKNFKKDEDE